MQLRPLRWFFFLFLSATFLISFTPLPVRADSLVVSPPNGMPGTTFQIQGSGFSANEQVDLWTQYPDGRILRLSSANADAGGVVKFKVSTDASYPLGSYLLAAHGTSSGNNVFGRLIIGGAGGNSISTGTGYCQGQNFAVPGFAPGERVVFSAQLPNGSVQVLGALTADGSGTASFTVPLSRGLPVGTYIITGQGLTSGHQTSDTLTFDGTTLAGSHCSISLSGYLPSYPLGVIPKNIAVYMGPGVYLGEDPNTLNYFACGWKWRPMGGIVYFLVLGFKPYEQVNVGYQIMTIQPDLKPYTTITADGNGYAALAVNTYSMPSGHYHWWFTSRSASYCGHYDH
jgi:hypothetical protein